MKQPRNQEIKGRFWDLTTANTDFGRISDDLRLAKRSGNQT